MVDITSSQSVVSSRLVPCHAVPMTGRWRDRSTTTTFLGSTGVATFATAGIGNSLANCPVDAAKRPTTRPPRHLATRST